MIGILIFSDFQLLDAAGPISVFEIAGRYAGRRSAIRPIAERAGPVKSSSGVEMLAQKFPRGALDTLIVAGGDGTRNAATSKVTLDFVRTQARRARRVASVCSGSYVLAEAGLLDGRVVTTHWAYCSQLAEKYPSVTVDPDPIFIKDGTLATSAGVTAGIDLALALLEDDLGRDTALTVARHLVVFLRRPGGQSQFSAQLQAQTATRKPFRHVQQWITEHPAETLTVESLALKANLSTRQFARAFTTEVGMTPGRYVDQVRIEAARRRLEDSADGIEEAARACGYGTSEAMRRAFIKTLGVSPAEYRRRFTAKENHADRHPALRPLRTP
jgi:transcriptional regulator GlxA family with amidase domain